MVMLFVPLAQEIVVVLEVLVEVDEVEDVVLDVLVLLARGTDVYVPPLSDALPTMLAYTVCGSPTYCGV